MMMSLRELAHEIANIGPVDYWAGAPRSEGWDIFETGGAEGHDYYEIEAVDFPGDDFDGELTEMVFANDAAAAMVVVGRALDGSVVHQRALAFLHQHAPVEFTMVLMIWLEDLDQYPVFEDTMQVLFEGLAVTP